MPSTNIPQQVMPAVHFLQPTYFAEEKTKSQSHEPNGKWHAANGGFHPNEQDLILSKNYYLERFAS